MHWVRRGAAGSGLLVAWAMALGFNFMGNGLRISFWGSSNASFPLPSLVINGEIASFFLNGQKQHKCLRIQITLQKILQKSLSALLVVAVYNAPPLWCQSGALPLDSLLLGEHVAVW